MPSKIASARIEDRRREFGQILQKAREGKGLTQKEVAGRLPLKDINVSKWERGEAPIPWKHILKLHDILDVPLEALLEMVRLENPSIGNTLLEIFHRARSRAFRRTPTVNTMPLRRLLEQYPQINEGEFIDKAIRYYASHAKYGVDLNLDPVHPPPELLPGRRAMPHPKGNPDHS